MKNFWRTILMLLILSSTTSLAKAQSQKVNLNKDQPAPFSGVLLTRPALAKIISQYEAKIKQLQADLSYQSKMRNLEKKSAFAICAVKIEAQKAKTTAQKDACTQQKGIYEGALKRANLPAAWHQSPYLHFTLGVVVTGGLCIASHAVRN